MFKLSILNCGLYPQSRGLTPLFDNLEMEKDWELMSELDKDELLDKKIVREL